MSDAPKMYDESKLNKIKVDPVKTGKNVDLGRIKGQELFPFQNWIAYICSKKKSGKTSLISTIIDRTTNKNTTVWIFCGTCAVDQTWLAIIKNLEDKGYQVNIFDAIFEGSGKKVVNNLGAVLRGLNTNASATKTSATKSSAPAVAAPEALETDRYGLPAVKMNIFGSAAPLVPLRGVQLPRGTTAIETKPPKAPAAPRIKVASNLFIFDDISTQLKNPQVASLLKTHRHSNSNVIVSSQYIHDLQPQSILQIDALIAFKSFSQEKMEYLHKMLDVSLPFEDFWSAYQQAVSSGGYDFFYFNARNEEVRRNFDHEIEIPR